MPNPPTSESMCAASVRMAKDPDHIPPHTSQNMKKRHTPRTSPSLLYTSSAFFYFSLKSSSISNLQIWVGFSWEY